MRVAPVSTKYTSDFLPPLRESGDRSSPIPPQCQPLRRTVTDWTANTDDGGRQVELRKLFYYRRVVLGMGVVASVWMLAIVSYHFAKSTYNYKNIAVSKASFTDAWVPTEEQIGDANSVHEWLTDTPVSYTHLTLPTKA